ncbi:hypothetical protein AB4072_08450 [Microvirga sp. 2MCAF38]|uniref:hypothetical protein n=1 Tax=Microvirga sp. 2MCAF38 TaxID=3232989 RepID=UPI003F9CDAC0
MEDEILSVYGAMKESEPMGEYAMSHYGPAIARHEDDNVNWLYSQFYHACAALLEKPLGRRGPFVLYDEDLKVAKKELVDSAAQSEEAHPVQD